MNSTDRARRIATLSARFRPTGVDDLTGAHEIKVSLLSPNPYQPRTTFDPAKLGELASSMRRRGRVLQALLVRETPGEEGAYQIAAGERRWRAAQLAGLETVPCIVEDLDDDAMEEIALTENIQREDLTDIELAYAFKRMLERRPALSRRALSENLGKAHNYVDNRLKLIADPRIAAAVEDGTIGATVAMELADLDDDVARADLLARASAGERIRVKDVQARPPRGGTAPAVADEPAPVLPADAMPGRDQTAPERRAGATRAIPQEPPVAPVRTASPDATDATPQSVERPGYGADQEEGWNADYDLPLTPADRERLAAERAEVLATVATPASPTVRLRELRIIQLREGRDGDPRQLDAAERATVLRVLRADLTWLEEIDRKADK